MVSWLERLATVSRPVIAARLLFVMPVVGLVECGRGSPSAGATDAAVASTTQVVSPRAVASGAATVAGAGTESSGPVFRVTSPTVFSAPIAAVRTHRELVVAGLVATEGIIRVMSLRDGPFAWSVDVLPGVAWIPDAELKLQPAGDGVAVVWRGSLDGKTGTTLVVLGPKGEPRGAPLSIGAGSCSTADGIAWIEPRTSGPARVRSRRWADAEPVDAITMAPDRAPTLSCGDHEVFVLGDGDDDLTATGFVPGAPARRSTVAIRDQDFGGDDEREHQAFVVGDDLGLVRVGEGGAISMREIATGEVSSWRRLKHACSADDDLVAVDGNAVATLLVLTREGKEPCPGSEAGAVSVRALRVNRKTGEEVALALAPAACDSSPGPFWIAQAPGGLVASWVHRLAKPTPGAAPIDGLVYRVIGGDGATPGLVEVQAEALVDAGCDETGCFVAALFRGSDADGSRAEPIVGLRYVP